MIKKSLLLAATVLSLIPTGKAQTQELKTCGTDEVNNKARAEHPEIKELEEEFERQIKAGLKKINLSTFAKKTAGDETNNPNFWYDIPVVVHIIHDFNTYNVSTFAGDFIPDDFIFKAVKDWNIVFAKQNSDTSDVILPFKKYIGNPRIRLRLATIDPTGNPTKGITRRRNYLTYAAGDDAKFDGWPNSSYLNLWFINKMSVSHEDAAAYAYKPSTAAYIPFYDGVISLAGYMNNGSKTMPHEIGHEFNLSHVWGDTNQPNVACGDDNVDDTPPTKGHNPGGCTPGAIFDSTCSTNYFKVLTDSLGHVTLINYPDTNNSQNIMDYTYCDKMFSKGQVERMHITLNSDIANRNNLWDSTNLVLTGALKGTPDLKPTPEFSLTHPAINTFLNKNAFFAYPEKRVRFTNFSYNDTVTKVIWEFTNGSTVITASGITFVDTVFTVPGWYDVKMTVTGNNTGDSSRTWSKAFYVPENAAINPMTSFYMQDFAEGSDRDKWPFFNIYNNEFKWQYTTVGMYDNAGIMYKGYDERVTPFSGPLTGNPIGDFDDLFSVPVNVEALGANAHLFFNYSGASRSSNPMNINDTLLIEYSVNKGVQWVSMAKLGKAEIFNMGAVPTPYVPASVTDWKEKGIKIPAGAKTQYTVFRFRYRPGVGSSGISTGNNFYMDRVTFSPFAVNVNNVNMNNANVSIVPNPTQGDAWVIVNDANNTDATVSVSDVTGKVVYTTTVPVKGSQARIIVPASAIAVKGIYIVNVLTGNQTSTQKLVVY